MTDRILGTRGKKRRRRFALLAPLVVLVFAMTMLVSASSGLAINTDASDYQTDVDVQGANDEPNQKDLTMQGTDTSEVSSVPARINVFWNWDDTRVNGNNTMDACALFDSDGDKLANFVLCAILQNLGTPKTFQYKESILYSCGDARDDRCTQPITVITAPQKSALTTCQAVLGSPTDPFDADEPNGPGDFYPNDTRIFCTVVLGDVSPGTTTAVLLNTCSYPSGEPNSDPSDCVVLPGKATPTINTTNVLIPQDSATLSGNASDLTGTSMKFQLYKDTSGDGICDSGELVFEQTDSTPADGFKTNNSGTESSLGAKDGYTVNSNGRYMWLVTFFGNSQNNGATQACNTEEFTVSNLLNS